ncbi:TIGR03617 family F420-dependent LLM class oxidoreductase [Micromonospora sp. AMSO12t]|uniref:TIGR03617 family F420-dependent LLM class oxidoreductase n=1 Tax=Micromonospora sp. AMSO12t TaxID=2650410 RepID=UPI001CED6DE9|nr:TIGR03617 family F420-dependent LLM class oxidoreductase [Micromonospora sp. AMSO12t]
MTAAQVPATRMELATTLPPTTALREVPAVAARIERLGFDTVHVPETTHDSLAVALLAAEHTSRITVRTSMTLAFPRSPMVTAYAAWDLARFSEGRFQLGLATQVRGNIVGRFSVPWDRPAENLRDYLASIRAIFAAFATGGPLEHEGSHYRFTRLQPYFNPGPLSTAAPALYTGGVNRRVCEVAGELADGFVTHATNSHPSHLRTVVLPALRAGAERAGRSRIPRVVVVSKSITGPTPAALAASRDSARQELAFLFSTPAYRTTLDRLGLGRVGERLAAMAASGRWAGLADTLDDETLATLIPHGTYAELPDVLEQAYGGLADGLGLGLPLDPADDEDFGALLERLRRIPTSTATCDPPATGGPSDEATGATRGGAGSETLP